MLLKDKTVVELGKEVRANAYNVYKAAWDLPAEADQERQIIVQAAAALKAISDELRNREDWSKG